MQLGVHQPLHDRLLPRMPFFFVVPFEFQEQHTRVSFHQVQDPLLPSQGPTKLAVLNAGWVNFLGWARKAASILLQKMLVEFEIMLESSISKHVKMENAGWRVGWQVFVGQPALAVLKCWLG